MPTTTPPAPVRAQDREGSPRAWVVWGLATLFVVWLFAIQAGYGIVSPQIQIDAQLSVAQVSAAATTYTFAFAIFQLFAGPLLDRFGARPLLVIAMALVAVGAFLYAGTTGFATLLLAQLVLALGSSFGFVGAGYVGGQWFAAARFGVMFGLVQAASAIGSAIAQPSIQAALDHITWQQLLLGFGVFGIILVVVSALLVRDPGYAVHPRGASLMATIGHGLLACVRTPAVLYGTVLAGVSFGTILAVGTFWGPRIMSARGADADVAALLSGAAWLGVAVGAPLVNIVSNKLGKRALPAVVDVLLQAAFVAAIVFVPLTATGTGPTIIAAVLMFCSGLFGGVNMLGFTVAAENAPAGLDGQSLAGSASSIVNAVCFVVAGLLISAPAWFMPAEPTVADYQSTLWIMPVILLIGAVAASRFPAQRRD